MIRSRKSDTYLHTDTILLKISEYDIFKYYCSPFVDLKKRFCSELRSDTSNDSVIIAFKGRLLYKDFGNPSHSFTCFTYVMHKYNSTFQEVLQIIDRDFGLNLGPKGSLIGFNVSKTKPKLYHKKIEDKKLTIIKKKRREWNMDDSDFWMPFNISKKILELFSVEPISHFWINAARFTCTTPTYAYKIGQKYKIYAPYEREKKWFSNTCSTQIQGEHMLNESEETLIITSSLKDIMCLYSFNIPAIAFQSELTMPDENIMEKLKNCYKDVIIFYDNDFTKEGNPGQTMAKKICDKYKLNNIYIPMQYSSKDISDFIKNSYKIKHIINYINDAKKKT